MTFTWMYTSEIIRVYNEDKWVEQLVHVDPAKPDYNNSWEAGARLAVTS